VAALGELGDPRAVEPLLSVLGNLDSEDQAIEIISRLGDERAIPALTRRWKQEDGGSGWYAHGACAARDAIASIRQRTQADQSGV